MRVHRLSVKTKKALENRFLYANVHCDALLMFYYHDSFARQMCIQRMKKSHFGLVIGLISADKDQQVDIFKDRGGSRGIKGLYWGTRNWLKEEDAYGFIPMLSDHLKKKFGNNRDDCFSPTGIMATLKDNVRYTIDEKACLSRMLEDEARINNDDGVDHFINQPV
jgi:hypothetical protein